VIPAIVHVASGREWRGGQRQVWLLARELSRRGIPQVVVTGRASELARRLTVSGVPVRPVTWRAGLDPRVFPALLQEIQPKPAILHAHDAHALTLAGIAAALSRAALVATRRVTFPIRRPRFWKQADHVIAISEAVVQSLRAAGVPPQRVTLVPDAVDLGALLSSPEYHVRQALNLPNNGQLAVTLGALTPEKDQSTLVEAAALLVRDLPSLHWAIVGDGPLRFVLERQIAHLGLQARVHLIGDLPDPHMALTGADVFVLSSVAEGLGSAVLAAMALEIPVVATRVGGVPDLLGEDRGVLVAPGNPAQFAAAVRRVLSQPDLRVRMTQAAYEEVRRFDVSAMAERVLEVYRSFAHSFDPS
jgi:glycosyltransferase involved in cell wall biosynthesis